MRKIILIGVSLSVAFLCIFVQFFPHLDAMADGRAEIIIDVDSGRVLEQKNADLRLPMASTTKIMTALIILEECDVDEVITVPDSAVGVEGSSIYLKQGEKISVKDLVYGLMLRSGNDSAVALAIHHSGSIERFADRMNAKARELGAENTHFANPSGLPDDKHFTTARDLGRIAAYAMKNDSFAKVVSTRSYEGDFRSFSNKNKLLYKLDGANGVKTGYTEKAGRCLVSSAERGGMQLVCVVLNCYDMYERSAKLLNGCFADYSRQKISSDRIFYHNGKYLKLAKDCSIAVSKNEKLEFDISEIKDAPPDSYGTPYAQLNIYAENNLIFCENLYSINM